MRIFLFLFATILTVSNANAQGPEEFENENILLLNFVNPETSDESINMSFFYSIDEFMEFKYSGIVSSEKVIAHRTWKEIDYTEDSIIFSETIVVEFGNEGATYRNIEKASYVCWAEYEINYNSDDEDKEFNERWIIHKADIDYQTGKLTYMYHSSMFSEKLHLGIQNPSIERIEFLHDLCQFYVMKNDESVEFSISNQEE